MNWFESNGISWEADLWGGLFKNNNGSTEWIIPDGPKSANVFALNIVAVFYKDVNFSSIPSVLFITLYINYIISLYYNTF